MIIIPEDGSVNTGFAGTQMPIIQNLGPGDLYVGVEPGNLPNTGLYLPAGAVFELPRVVQEGIGAVWVQAVNDQCDVRILNVG